MSWNINNAVTHATLHALPSNSKYCARYVCNAIRAGGINIVSANAKDLGSSLQNAGFYVVSGTPKKGDIAVIQAAPDHPYGHACIYDGHQWISDYKQQNGMYPAQIYGDQKTSFKIYRHD